MSRPACGFGHSSVNRDRQGAAPATIADWLQVVRSEYLEMPGLRLTRSQVRRLWGLDPVTCDGLLQALIDERFLRRTHGGDYVRADGDDD
jgi:hypothetical protein